MSPAAPCFLRKAVGVLFHVVAGAHRLAAAKSLGWSHIDCIEVEDDAITAELWELAENLNRHDLSKEQRDAHIRRYAELLTERREVLRQSGAKPITGPLGGRPQGVAAEISANTGLSKRTVDRALNPKPPKPHLVEVKDAFDVVASQADAIVRAWNRACPEARQLVEAREAAKADTVAGFNPVGGGRWRHRLDQRSTLSWRTAGSLAFAH